MFRIYLRDHNQQVTSKTNTGDPAAAIAAFEVLVNRTDLDGKPVMAVITENGSPVAHHKFTARPGDAMHYWRGRIDEIELPGFGKPASGWGGAREGAGRKAADEPSGLVRKLVMLDEPTIEEMRRIGDGNLSLGIRRAAARLHGLGNFV